MLFLFLSLIFFRITLSVIISAALIKLGSEKKFRIFWWNQLTDRTLVQNARFGARSKRAVIISLGGVPSRSGDYSNSCSFLHRFLNFNALYKRWKPP